jgi:hypothetical protein
VGGLGALGLSLPNAVSAAPASGGAFGKAKSCIVLFLLGGPPRWDAVMNHVTVAKRKPTSPRPSGPESSTT